MVQVDVFWTYGLGASFAVAAHRQLARNGRDRGTGPFEHRAYVALLLFLALVFVPSTVYMFWAFPSWQTMHVGGPGMPAWLVTALVAVNILTGITGFWVAWRLARAGRVYGAFLQWMAGYFLMFLVAAYGWDGTGYQRYFSVTPADLARWSWAEAAEWNASDIAVAVNVFSLIMIPILFYLISTWLKEGYALEPGLPAPGAQRTRLAICGWLALLIFGVVLVAAIGTSLLLQYLGVAVGLAVAAAVIYAAGIRRGGIVHRLYRRLLLMP